MSVTNRKPVLEVARVETTEARQENQGYTSPELHVVGEAGELVQGNFGYTDRDERYYRC